MSTTVQELTRTADGVAVPAVGTWIIDGSHTSAEFVVRHLMVAKVRGSFGSVAGTIEVAEDPAASSVAVVIDTASVSTGDADRDGHIRTADFFDIENHPEMRFVSTAVRSSGSSWVLDGELDHQGHHAARDSRVRLPRRYHRSIWQPEAAFSATTTINREDWNLNWNVPLEAGGVLVSKKVNIEIEMQAGPANG